MPVQFWSKEKTYHPKDIALSMTQSKELVVSDKEKENIFNFELLKDIKFLIFLAKQHPLERGLAYTSSYLFRLCL